MHVPVHAADTHAKGHVAPEFCQPPDTLHVCGCSLLHRLAPGAHAPVHAPSTHVWLAQGVVAPHSPPTHFCTPLAEHREEPGEHAPPSPSASCVESESPRALS